MASDRLVAGTGTVIRGQLLTHLGSPLPVSGVYAEFSASSGATFLPDSAATDRAGAFEATHTAPLSVTVPGERPFLDVSLAGQRHRFQYSTVAGPVSAGHSSVTLSPVSALPGGSVVVQVTPRDVHDLPSYDAPTLTGTGGVSIGAPDAEDADNGDRTFIFPVTVPASAGPVTFTATSGGVTVSSATLSVLSPLVVLDGTQPVGRRTPSPAATRRPSPCRKLGTAARTA